MYDSKLRVSLGFPVYNGEAFIKEALDSLLSQTFESFELIISDNASTDGTQEICRAYAARDSRIRYYRYEHNRGAAWNHNHVFELSTGEYFKWAAHDDICAPQYLERCVEVLDSMPAVVLCYPRSIIIDEHGGHLRNYAANCHVHSSRPYERFRHLLTNFALSDPMYGVARTKTLARTARLGHYIASDIVLMAELALYGEIYEVPESLFFRRDHPQKSARANHTSDDLAAWYDPVHTGKVVLPRWRWFFECLRSIKRIRIPYYEKACCLMYMAKWLRWHWQDMQAELVFAVKSSRGLSRLFPLALFTGLYHA